MTVVATFENGVFVPREEVHLPAGTEVTIDVDEVLAERARRLRAIEAFQESIRSTGKTFPPDYVFDRGELYP